MDTNIFQDDINLENLTLIQRKAIKYSKITGDLSVIAYVFEPFEGRNYLSKDFLLPHCNSLYICRKTVGNETYLHKSDKWFEEQERIVELLNSKIADDEV